MTETPLKILLMGDQSPQTASLGNLPAEVRRWTGDAAEWDGVDVVLITGQPPLPDPPMIRDGLPGIVRVGHLGAADACLEADATPREIALACCLVGEIVHLRRELHGRAEQNRRLIEESRTDPLTGLANRRAWDQRLSELADSSPTEATTWCLAVLDVDGFKRLNDTLGHDVGDRVLRAMGQAISGSIRRGDFAARIGGDEVALLLPIPDAATAHAVVDRVRRKIPDGSVGGELPAIGVSAGCSVGKLPRPEEVNSLFLRADKSLRQAKSEGGNRTIVGD